MLTNDFTQVGYAVLKDLLDNDTCKEFKRVISSIISSGPQCACSRPNNTLHMLNWKSNIVQHILENEFALNALRKVTGATDLRWISGYVSIKESFSPPLWWHQDWWCWSHEVSYSYQAPQIAVMIYIDATTNQNGALRILPSSHHQSDTLHQYLQEVEQMGTSIPDDHACMVPHTRQLLLELKAGDAVIIDYRLLHGTEANSTRDRRDCIILNFAPHWRGLPPEIQAHLAGHAAQPENCIRSSLHNGLRELLPVYEGDYKMLSVNRTAPSDLHITHNIISQG